MVLILLGLPCLLIYLSLGYAWRVFAFVFLLLFYFFPSSPIRSGEVFSSVIFFLSFSSFVCVFGSSDGMEREACVCDHGFERSDVCAEIIIIIIGEARSRTYFTVHERKEWPNPSREKN